MDRARPRPGDGRGVGGVQRRGTRPPVRQSADLRYGRSSRTGPRWARRDEPRGRAADHLGRRAGAQGPRSRRLSGRGRRRRQARLGDVRTRGRRGASRRRLHGDVDVRRGADSGNRVRRPPSRRQRGHPDHRVAQSAVGQRLQGVLRQRDPDRCRPPTGISRRWSAGHRTPTRFRGPRFRLLAWT